jgi:Fibrobacter succinogenes major domain (Fib_succ_major).
MKNTFAKKFTVCALAGVLGFALSACDDSSSAGGDDNNVILSGDSREESSDSRSNDKDEAISSSGKVTDKDSELAEVSSSSVVSSSSIGDVSKSYAETKVMPSGTFDCSKYNCFTTEYLNQEFLEAGKYGEILDERDGQVYKTVQIGEQIWMAQNLNYADSVSTPSLLGRSWCYEDKPEYCAIAGRFYTWAAAIDSVKLANDTDNPRDCGFGKYCSFTREQGLCPNGWHLPDTTEWNVLIATVDGSKNLMSKVGWFWDYGTDEYGFSAFPAGEVYRGDPTTYADSRSADFFALTDQLDDVNEGHTCYFINLFGNMDNKSMSFKDSGFSIRCIKD